MTTDSKKDTNNANAGDKDLTDEQARDIYHNLIKGTPTSNNSKSTANATPAKPTQTGDKDKGDKEKSSGGIFKNMSTQMILIIVVIVLLLAFLVWYFLLRAPQGQVAY